MKNTAFYILISVFCFLCFQISAQTPAFPSAEGHGRYATGGRGGAVYYVTTLDDNNSAGSLRYAVTRSGARTVLFKVSGTIYLNSELKINNPNLTVAGQSAPGDGICLAGNPVNVNADNVIIRYLRFRMGDILNTNADGADALGGRFHQNIIIDHCSVSWSTDECCSFYQNTNFTMQWCLISESMNFSAHSKGEHGYGGIWGGFGASFHHNLMAHHKSRVPRLGPGANTTPTNELVDIRNNVYYNYKGEGCYGAEAMHCNIVNNYYKGGPANASQSTAKKKRIIAIDKKTDNSFPVIENLWGTFYIDGNVVDGQSDVTDNNWQYGVYNQFASKYGTVSQADRDAMKLLSPLPTGTVTTHTAQQAYEKVLAYAGCSLHRDAIDVRIVSEAQTNTAAFQGAKAALPGIIDTQNDLRPASAPENWTAWCELAQGEAPTDADNDGIPDDWFAANVPASRSITANSLNADGYTYLEIYLNSLVETISAAQNAGGTLSGIETQKKTSDLNVKYNPKMREINILADENLETVEIFDITGKIIVKSVCSSNTFSVNLPLQNEKILLIKAAMKDKTVKTAKVIM